jgi:cation diffusion facilitator family transporter
METGEKKILWTVLCIDLAFFVIELVSGWLANSMGLIADSFDMLTDGLIYALALFAVGSSVIRKKRVARFAGIFQIILAIIGFIEIVRRFIGAEAMPEFQTMVLISAITLIANTICLSLLQKNQNKDAHIQASIILTHNDVIINSGVIIAGILVHYLNSNYPDLIIGAVIFVVVLRGAFKMLRLSK